MLGVLSAVGCGTVSARYVMESDMRFEHCYRIDEDPRYPLYAKRTCWWDWHEHYERGQDANRITYVAERLRVLDTAAAGGATVATPTIAAATSTACPIPTSPYAPPPPVVTSGMSIGVNAGSPVVTCGDGCNRDWKTCSPTCNSDGACLGLCDDKLRACMKACSP